jgi:DNA-binding winged helix-turn-helix (wHTH) protein
MAAKFSSGSKIRFGPFELNLGTGELWRSNQRVKLAPQPSNLLILLADRAGHLVSREDIQQRLWGAETYVDFEQGLNFSIR